MSITGNPERLLYWDIDGTILDYNDVPKLKLVADHQFEKILKTKRFDQLACISGWSSILVDEPVVHRRLSDAQMKDAIWQLITPAVFSDYEYFDRHVVLLGNNDERAQHIRFDLDWYLIDDLAEHFVVKAHG